MYNFFFSNYEVGIGLFVFFFLIKSHVLNSMRPSRELLLLRWKKITGSFVVINIDSPYPPSLCCPSSPFLNLCRFHFLSRCCWEKKKKFGKCIHTHTPCFQKQNISYINKTTPPTSSNWTRHASSYTYTYHLFSW